MKESLDFYKQLSDDNRSRLEEVLKRNDELENDVKNLRNQMFLAFCHTFAWSYFLHICQTQSICSCFLPIRD